MFQQLAIGLGAGAASALLYFAVSSGTVLAAILFYVAPLPVIVAGLGWGWLTGFVAAVAGAALAGAATAPLFGVAFFLGCSAPAAWLARLALLGRAGTPEGSSQQIEWYPAGRLLIWTAALGAAVILIAVLVVGGGPEAFRASVEDAVQQLIEGGAGAQIGLPQDVDPQALTEVLSVMLPPASAAVWTLTMGFNLWLGGRIVHASGRLPRPMPQVSHIELPSTAAMAFAGLLVLSFLPGIAGSIGAIGSASLAIAYVILGLAVVHVVTRGITGRGFLLGALYAVMLLLAWTIPLLGALGLAESLLKLRRRAADSSNHS